MNPQNPPLDSVTRRNFLKSSTGAVIGGALASPFVFTAGANAEETKTIKIGLIGCGGRGTGAAGQALGADKNIKLTAMGDAFSDRLELSLSQLAKAHPEKVDVSEANKFVGLDAYQKVIDSGVDLVCLTTPPGFRPLHLKAAIAAGKHVFCEKPVATDAPGIRQVLEICAEAKRKNLAVMSGFCWRHNFAERETFKRIHEGAIGDVRAVYGDYLTGTLWYHDRQPGWTDFENQVHNWMYYTWLSGDMLVEQAVHSVDKMLWITGDKPPLRAIATGGRQVRTEEKWGHIYDHFAVQYEFEKGTRGYIFARQQAGCFNENSDHIMGSKGSCDVNGFNKIHHIMPFDGAEWNYDGPRNDMYQTEHDELFASIRAGTPINDGEWMCRSTLTAIMGRMAAYTGQAVTWEMALNSKESLAPEGFPTNDWNLPVTTPPVAMPGRTKFI